MDEKELVQFSKFPQVRRRISRMLARKEPIAVGISGKKGEFVHFRMEDPKKFDSRAFRVKGVGRTGTRLIIGCPKGGWDAKRGVCRVGTRAQSVLVPKSRVQAVIGQVMKTAALKRKVAANPQYKSNPILAVSLLNPAKKSHSLNITRRKSIPFAQFDKWVRSHMPPQKVREYEKALKAYRRFHMGATPRSVSYKSMKIGDSKRIADVGFGYSAGRAPASTYETPRHSGKEPAMYLHKWKNRPEVIITADGKSIMMPLRGGAKVSDWMRG